MTPERMAQRLRPSDVEERYLQVAGHHRDEAESLIRGMEVLARKFSALQVVPLDLLDRCERMVVSLHTANLMRLGHVSDATLAAVEGEE